MERPRSTSKSHPFSSSSPSGVPTPLSIPTPQSLRRGHGTPLLALDGDLSLSRLDRISPRQRTPIETTAGTPQLAAAVSEAKREGATAPSPSPTDIPMDQFDRLLSKHIRFTGTPSPTTLDESGSPFAATAVHSVLADETRRRELLIGLQKLMQVNAGTSSATATGKSFGAGSRNDTPRQTTSPGHHLENSPQTASGGAMGRAPREVSPLQHHTSPRAEWHHTELVPFTHVQPKNGLVRPKAAHGKFAEALAKRDVPTSKKVIKSELSAFSETTESCSLTSYSTSKSVKTA